MTSDLAFTRIATVLKREMAFIYMQVLRTVGTLVNILYFIQAHPDGCGILEPLFYIAVNVLINLWVAYVFAFCVCVFL